MAFYSCDLCSGQCFRCKISNLFESLYERKGGNFKEKSTHNPLEKVYFYGKSICQFNVLKKV